MTNYEKCADGPYAPFRDHNTAFRWGVFHQPTGRIFALVGAKGMAFSFAAFLNGHTEAAIAFRDEGGRPIPDEYFARFPELGKPFTPFDPA